MYVSFNLNIAYSRIIHQLFLSSGTEMLKKVAERTKLQMPEFDVMSDVLETLRFRGSIFFNSKLAAPWGMKLKMVTYPRFHIVLKGSCFVGSSEAGLNEVAEMSVVLMPKGCHHWIADQPNRDMISCEEAGEACRLNSPLFQNGEITHQLICGQGQYDLNTEHPIFDALPPILHFSGLKNTDPIWLTAMQIDGELNHKSGSGGAQGSQIVDRLSEVMFLQLLKRHIDENPETAGYLAALGDRRIHRALERIHQNPEFEWSLTLLGEQTGMSRATLGRNFKDALGVTPMHYINTWRLIKARSLVKYSNHKMGEIAEMVGFASSRTLGKAFKRQFGCTAYELKNSHKESKP